MKKLIFVALFFVLQSLYVFGILITALAYADYFPRIVSTVFFWFVLPIIGIPIMGVISKKLLTLMKIFIDDDAYFLPYAITAITLWIPLLVGINTGIDEYFSLNIRGATIAETVHAVPQLAEKGFIEVKNSIVKNRLSWMHVETTSIKTGDKISSSAITYFCAPVYGKGEAISDPIKLWACDTSDFIKRQDFNPEIVKGRVIHNRYDTNYYSLAIKDAEKNHQIISSADPVFLAPTKNSYEQLLELKELHAAIFGVSVFFIWILFATVITAKMIPVESSPIVPGEFSV